VSNALSRGTFLAGAAAVSTTVLWGQNAEASKPLGIVGFIKPTRRIGSLEELIPFLPPGLAMVPVYLDFTKGTKSEFSAGISLYEKQIAFLAGKGCDLISAEGAPVFMIQGYPHETAILKRWKQRYKIPTITSSSSQVDALHALKVKSFVGATYLPAEQNVLYAKYFAQAGFNPLSMNGIDVPFDKVQTVPSSQIADYIKSEFAKHPNADAVYMLGSGWRTTDIIESLEKELGVPVIHPVAARAWDIQKFLGLHYPIKGYGKLLAQFP
jgi:maleate cis-trans isomerase